MTEHRIEVVDGEPTPKGLPRFLAVCSCGRWRSKQYETRGDAIDNSLIHSTLGDLQNRASAALGRGPSGRKAQAAWYAKQAEDPLTPEGDRELWRQLADGMNAVPGAQDDEGQDPLF